MSESTVASKDGTTIAYREIGDGPGVVLIHGAMQAAQNFSKLAEALSTSFRVYVPNRRGRGKSGAFGSQYGLAREAEDVEALLRKTGARFVFGLSSGAIISLYTALNVSGVDKLAIYEPPLTVDGAQPAAWGPRYLSEVERGDFATAMVTVLKGTGDVAPLTYLPRILLTRLMRMGIRADAAKAGPNYVPIRDLIPTVRYDLQIQRESDGLVPRLVTISSEILLLGGNRSHRSLRIGLDSLARRLPRARRVVFRGCGHLAADDTGRPPDVARELRAFFESGAR